MTQVSSRERGQLLGIYLNDHLAGATAGTALAGRVAAGWSGPGKEQLQAISEQIASDRASLVAIMKRCDITADPVKVLGGRLAERVGRLKPNAHLLSRSPLSAVEEVEMLRLGVLGKATGWRTLRRLADHDPRLDGGELDTLLAQAAAQAEDLENLRMTAVDRLWSA